MAVTRIALPPKSESAEDRQAKLDMSTAEIGLTVRTTNCLEEKGIFTVRDLLNCTREDLLGISNFGEKTLEEVLPCPGKYRFRSRKTERHIGNVGVIWCSVVTTKPNTEHRKLLTRQDKLSLIASSTKMLACMEPAKT